MEGISKSCTKIAIALPKSAPNKSNIFKASGIDFIKAEHRVYHNSKYATYIELPVMKN